MVKNKVKDIREPTVLSVPGGITTQSDAIFYFPREVTPRAKKEITKNKILGASLIFTGIAILIAGYAGTKILEDVKGLYLLMAILAAVGAGLFFYIPNVNLIGLIRGSMAVVYLIITIAIFVSIFGGLSHFDISDMEKSMDELQNSLPGISEFLIIAGALVTRIGGNILKESIKELVDYSPAVIVLPSKFGK